MKYEHSKLHSLIILLIYVQISSLRKLKIAQHRTKIEKTKNIKICKLKKSDLIQGDLVFYNELEFNSFHVMVHLKSFPKTCGTPCYD